MRMQPLDERIGRVGNTSYRDKTIYDDSEQVSIGDGKYTTTG
jgi:hypothetical protein